MWIGGIVYQVWDVQNDHTTSGTTCNLHGKQIFWDKEFPEGNHYGEGR